MFQAPDDAGGDGLDLVVGRDHRVESERRGVEGAAVRFQILQEVNAEVVEGEVRE